MRACMMPAARLPVPAACALPGGCFTSPPLLPPLMHALWLSCMARSALAGARRISLVVEQYMVPSRHYWRTKKFWSSQPL